MKKIIAVIAIVLIIGAFIIFQKSQTSSDVVTAPTQAPNDNSQSTTSGATYKDGSYTGTIGSASQYGDVQVKVIISGGKLTDIQYLKFPSGGGHTAEVTAMAKPALKQEAITAQSASINVVSGATQDTEGFIQSLQSALDQAKS
jgi:uncharacterized protein with FMN-binding domain